MARGRTRGDVQDHAPDDHDRAGRGGGGGGDDGGDVRETAARGSDASCGGVSGVGTPARRRLGHRGINHGSARDETRSVDDARVRLALVADQARVGVDQAHRGWRAKHARARGGVRDNHLNTTLKTKRRKRAGYDVTFCSSEKGTWVRFPVDGWMAPDGYIFRVPGNA